MDMMMKRSIVVLAAAFAAMSTSAFAENGAGAANIAQQSKSSALKLSDAELDRITAGAGALTEVFIFNRGEANVRQGNGHHLTCVNCDPTVVPGGATGAVVVITPNRTDPIVVILGVGRIQ
jgi:hypothetical protein